MTCSSVGKIVLEAQAHQSYPFNQLIEALDLPRDLSRAPLFDHWVQLRENETPDNTIWKESGLEWEDLTPTNTASKFDLAFYFTDQPEGLQLRLNTIRTCIAKAPLIGY